MTKKKAYIYKQDVLMRVNRLNELVKELLKRKRYEIVNEVKQLAK